MTIRFACQCGKQLQANADFGGRRMKCPTCGQVLQIPYASTESPEMPVVSAAPSTTGQGATRGFGVEPPPEVLPVRSPAAPRVSRLRQKVAKGKNIWEGNSLDQQITPWPKGDNRHVGAVSEKDRNFGQWFLAILLLLVLAGGTFAACYYWSEIDQSVRLHAEVFKPKPTVFEKVSDLDMVPRDSGLFMSLRVADAWEGPARIAIEKNLFGGNLNASEMRLKWGLSPSDIERLTIFSAPNAIVDLGRPMGLCLLVRTKSPYNHDRMRRILTERVYRNRSDGVEVEVKPLVRRPGVSVAFLNKQTLMFAAGNDIDNFLRRIPAPERDGPLSNAIKLAEKENLAVISAQIPSRLRNLLVKGAPPQTTALIAEMLQNPSLAVTFNQGKQGELAFHLNYADGDGAGAAETKANMWRESVVSELTSERAKLEARKNAWLSSEQRTAQLVIGAAALNSVLPISPVQILAAPIDPQMAATIRLPRNTELLDRIIKSLDESLAVVKKIAVKKTGNSIQYTYAAGDKDMHPLETAASFHQRLASHSRLETQQKLKLIALALHNYHSVHNRLPQAEYKENLSWQIALLPFLEQVELFKHIESIKEWDQATVRALAGRMPAVFAPTAASLGRINGRTFFQVFIGDGAAFEKGIVRFADFKDGTSTTILVVEGFEPSTWTRFKGLATDAADAPALFGGLFTNHFQAAFADGSVRPIPVDLSPMLLRARITRNGNDRTERPKIDNAEAPGGGAPMN